MERRAPLRQDRAYQCLVTGKEDNQFSIQRRQNFDEESLLKCATSKSNMAIDGFEMGDRPGMVISTASQSRGPWFKSPPCD
jgi:hypothetical protein